MSKNKVGRAEINEAHEKAAFSEGGFFVVMRQARSPGRLLRALDQAEAVLGQARLANWSEQAVAWVNAHGEPDVQDALTRWLAALLAEHALSVWLDDSIDEATFQAAEHEQGLAAALNSLGLGEFRDEDVGRLLALVPRLHVELAPLADMMQHSLSTAEPGA